MRYTTIDRRVFRLKKDAEEWIEKQKKEKKAGVDGIRTETNFLEDLNQWEGVVLIKVNENNT